MKLALSHLAPFVTVPDGITLSQIVPHATRTVEPIVARSGYAFEGFVEREHLNDWRETYQAPDSTRWTMLSLATCYSVPLSWVRRCTTNADAAGELSDRARVAALAHARKIDRVMLRGTTVSVGRRVPGIVELVGSELRDATDEVIMQAAVRLRSESRPAEWSRARGVVGILLEQLHPQWVAPPTEKSWEEEAEPHLVFRLLSRVAGVVPGAAP